jgi:hypothetical protein
MASRTPAEETRSSDPIEELHPAKLLSPRRMDLVCKYLYFRELASAQAAGGTGASIAAGMYEKHIHHRTGGVEPPDPYEAYSGDSAMKVSLADYTRQAQTLLASLQSRGFDRSAAITYFRDGTLGNGAHRLSAALALNIPVFARVGQGEGTAWPFRWFLENGFTLEELQRLLYTYTQLKPEDVIVFVLYSPSQRYWDRFGQLIAQRFYSVGHLDVSVESPLAMYELIHDLYGTADPVSATSVINRKALLLAMAPLTVRVVVAERHNNDQDVYAIADSTKTECRELAHDTVAREIYLSAHASSSKEETLNLAGVLLSPNNLHQLRRRVSAGVRGEFGEWLTECRRSCAREGIAIDDICVVGSSPLEVVGVRASTDVDFTLKSECRRVKYGPGVTHLSPAVDIVTAGYHHARNGPAIDDDELIENPEWHFRYRGLKFANPEVVLDQKDFYRREKDVRDLEEAGRKLGALEPAAFNPAFHFAACTEALLRLITGASPLEARTHAMPAASRVPHRPPAVSAIAWLRQPLATTVKSILRRVRRRLASAAQRN